MARQGSIVFFVPELSSAPIPPKLFLLVRKAYCSVNFKPSLPLTSCSRPLWTMDSFGKELNIPLFTHLLFFGPAPTSPVWMGRKMVLRWDTSTEKPEPLESKLIIQTWNQGTKITASIYSTTDCPLGSLTVHSTLNPPRGRWEAETHLTPLTPSILLCSFLKLMFMDFAPFQFSFPKRTRGPCSPKSLIKESQNGGRWQNNSNCWLKYRGRCKLF